MTIEIILLRIIIVLINRLIVLNFFFLLSLRKVKVEPQHVETAICLTLDGI